MFFPCNGIYLFFFCFSSSNKRRTCVFECMCIARKAMCVVGMKNQQILRNIVKTTPTMSGNIWMIYIEFTEWSIAKTDTTHNKTKPRKIYIHIKQNRENEEWVRKGKTLWQMCSRNDNSNKCKKGNLWRILVSRIVAQRATAAAAIKICVSTSTYNVYDRKYALHTRSRILDNRKAVENKTQKKTENFRQK